MEATCLNLFRHAKLQVLAPLRAKKSNHFTLAGIITVELTFYLRFEIVLFRLRKEA